MFVFSTYFLQLIRIKNLVFLAFTYTLIHFVYIPKFFNKANLSILEFVIFTFSVLLVMAAGNVINDIYDMETDKINKPKSVLIPNKITLEKAFKIYLYLNIFGLILATYLAINTRKIFLPIIVIITVILLFIYSKALKKKMLLGNLLVSFLISLSVLLQIYVDVPNIESEFNLFLPLLLYTLFAFLLNFMREIIKDIQDIKGDSFSKMQTFPIVYGKRKAIVLVQIIGCIVIGILGFIVFQVHNENLFLTYSILCILFLMFYLIIKLQKKDNLKIERISFLLKITMLLGVLTIFQV